jgi:hypothetical protein
MASSSSLVPSGAASESPTNQDGAAAVARLMELDTRQLSSVIEQLQSVHRRRKVDDVFSGFEKSLVAMEETQAELVKADGAVQDAWDVLTDLEDTAKSAKAKFVEAEAKYIEDRKTYRNAVNEYVNSLGEADSRKLAAAFKFVKAQSHRYSQIVKQHRSTEEYDKLGEVKIRWETLGAVADKNMEWVSRNLKAGEKQGLPLRHWAAEILDLSNECAESGSDEGKTVRVDQGTIELDAWKKMVDDSWAKRRTEDNWIGDQNLSIYDRARDILLEKKIVECHICMDAVVDTVLEPCGHKLCGACAKKLKECPDCREKITGIRGEGDNTNSTTDSASSGSNSGGSSSGSSSSNRGSSNANTVNVDGGSSSSSSAHQNGATNIRFTSPYRGPFRAKYVMERVIRLRNRLPWSRDPAIFPQEMLVDILADSKPDLMYLFGYLPDGNAPDEEAPPDDDEEELPVIRRLWRLRERLLDFGQRPSVADCRRRLAIMAPRLRGVVQLLSDLGLRRRDESRDEEQIDEGVTLPDRARRCSFFDGAMDEDEGLSFFRSDTMSSSTGTEEAEEEEHRSAARKGEGKGAGRSSRPTSRGTDTHRGPY